MDKTNLKENYGDIINTDKLTDDIMELLNTYNHRPTEHGVTTMLNEFFNNKSKLIELVKKSPKYNGDLRITFDAEFERENSGNEIRRFLDYFLDKIEAKNVIMRKTDADGKTLQDYIANGPKFYYARDLLEPEKYAKMENDMAFFKKFTADGYLVEDEEKFNKLQNCVSVFKNIQSSQLSEKNANDINACLPEQTKKSMVAEGMKTSRAMNRVCEAFGITKAKNYNKAFAEYSDMVSGKTRTLKVVISCNPYDYLTMSFGVNWASCHTIDKTNKRHIGDGSNGYHGAYCGGTLSYMLDGTSLIMYIVKPDDDVQTAGKIYRNMFHWNGHNLVQSRIYPQGNDGATDLYKKFRGIVQDEFADMLGLESRKWVRSTDIGKLGICSNGAHYRDYIHFDDCSYSYPQSFGSDTGSEFIIGHSGVCVHCGEEIAYGDQVSHSSCKDPSEHSNISFTVDSVRSVRCFDEDGEIITSIGDIA